MINCRPVERQRGGSDDSSPPPPPQIPSRLRSSHSSRAVPAAGGGELSASRSSRTSTRSAAKAWAPPYTTPKPWSAQHDTLSRVTPWERTRAPASARPTPRRRSLTRYSARCAGCGGPTLPTPPPPAPATPPPSPTPRAPTPKTATAAPRSTPARPRATRSPQRTPTV
jgi:hypothetical protein